MPTCLIYGANGYTGTLIAQAVVARGLRPILAGRDAEAIALLGRGLALPTRVFALDEPAVVEEALREVQVVLNCAGPFSRTAKPIAASCLRTGTHYLDVTGEVAVFEALAAMDQEARTAGVMLLPGVGFDVVPSDCLAAHLKHRLPSATHLALGFTSLGRVSRGTATTMLENIHRGGLVRRGGLLTPVPTAWDTRIIDFGTGPRHAITIPWGDVATAYYSTGIPNIEVYMAASFGVRLAARLSRYFGWVLGSAPAQRFLKWRIRAGSSGPTTEERGRGRSYLWGEATDDTGHRAVARLRGPDGYTLTAAAAIAILERVLGGEARPGYQTPSTVFGPDFVLTLPQIVREDEDLTTQ